MSPPPPRIQPVRIEPLTDEAFRPFGQVLGAGERAPDYRGGGGSYGWRVDFQADGRPRVSVSVAPFQGRRFTRLERHFHVTQTFVPLDGARAVVAVAPPTDPADREAIPAPETVRAFLIDGTRGYLLWKGTWHSIDRFPLDPLFNGLRRPQRAGDGRGSGPGLRGSGRLGANPGDRLRRPLRRDLRADRLTASPPGGEAANRRRVSPDVGRGYFLGVSPSRISSSPRTSLAVAGRLTLDGRGTRLSDAAFQFRGGNR